MYSDFFIIITKLSQDLGGKKVEKTGVFSRRRAELCYVACYVTKDVENRGIENKKARRYQGASLRAKKHQARRPFAHDGDLFIFNVIYVLRFLHAMYKKANKRAPGYFFT
jgi:hypothetical protein